MREQIIGSPKVDQSLFDLCTDYLHNNPLDVEVAKALEKKISAVLKRPTEENIYYASQILTKIQAQWNCFELFRQVSLEVLRRSYSEDFLDLVYPTSVVLGLCAHEEQDGKLVQELRVSLQKFYLSGSKEAAKHLATALCLAEIGNSPKCFRRDIDPSDWIGQL